MKRDYKILTRPLPDYDGDACEELVFNYTEADYFSLVKPENVSPFNCINMYGVDPNGVQYPIEVRTVNALYRGKRYCVTIVRFDRYFFGGPMQNSFGRQIALNMSDYFGEPFYRESDISEDLWENGNVDLDKNRYSFQRRAKKPNSNPYVLCFNPSHIAREGYYYQACLNNEYTTIPLYSGCPYGRKELNTSLVDKDKVKNLEDKISQLQTQIHQIDSIQTEYKIEFEYDSEHKINWDKYHEARDKEWSYLKLQKEVKHYEKLLAKNTTEATKQRNQRHLEAARKEMMAHPLYETFARLEEGKRKKEEMSEEMERMRHEIYELKRQKDKEESKAFFVPMKVHCTACLDCQLYNYDSSFFSKGIVCKMSPFKKSSVTE